LIWHLQHLSYVRFFVLCAVSLNDCRCQGDFGLAEKPRKGDIIEIGRNESVNDAGVFVLDQFKGSGKKWPFKILEVALRTTYYLPLSILSSIIALSRTFSSRNSCTRRLCKFTPNEHPTFPQVCEENFCGSRTRYRKNAGFRSRGGISIAATTLAFAATGLLWATR